MPSTNHLDAVNRAPDDQATERLRACNAAPRWIAEVLAGRPYADLDAALDTAEQAARTLPWTEVRTALDAHPRIGERAQGDDTESRWSRREQAAVGRSDPAVQEALRTGNADYERRFGHVFLIRAADRAPAEILAELRRRLGNDEAGERAEVTEQLAQITRLRLERLLTG
jgi:2-oxo-4-hydroxy-4-carboxy-5-ureidoimidazoline decarboxylase